MYLESIFQYCLLGIFTTSDMLNDGQILLKDSKKMKIAVKGLRESFVEQLNVDDNDEERIVYSNNTATSFDR